MKVYLILFLFFTSFICITLSIYAVMKRQKPAALPFAGLMAAASIHSFAYGFELMSQRQVSAVLWINIEYIGLAFFPFLLLWMTYAQKNDDHYRNTIGLIVFFAVSLTTFFLVQTNHYHHLYYSHLEYAGMATLTKVRFIKGPWYYVHAGMLLISYTITASYHYTTYKETKKHYKEKAFYALVSLVIMFCAVLMYALKWTPQNLELLPFIYIPAGLLWFISFIKYGIFDLSEVTYKTIFEHIREGVVILDRSSHIINFNLAAYQLFRSAGMLIKGEDFRGILNEVQFINNPDYPSQVFQLNQGGRLLTYHISSTPLYDKQRHITGYIIVINDITKESEASKVLQKLANKDALTGINNRRHFFDLCKECMARARREGKKVSFILMDIDHFKRVNDSYGHQVGDKVLKEVTDLCSSSLRGTDLIGRYGGEEFGVLLYDAELEITNRIVERMRKTISEHRFWIDDKEFIQLTVSFGIYRPELILEQDLDSIFEKADRGLYQAKSEGRDRIIFYSEHVN